MTTIDAQFKRPKEHRLKDITVQFSEAYEGKSKEELLSLLDHEVDDFSQFMSTLGDWRSVGPLNPPERALIKTYLVHKITGKIDGVKK